MVTLAVLMFGMKNQARRAAEVGIDEHAHRVPRVVNEPEWRYRPRRDAKVGHQALRRTKAQTIVADDLDERAQVGALGDLENHEIVAIAFLVAQEQVLDLRGVDARPVRSDVLGIENRRMGELLYGMPSASRVAYTGTAGSGSGFLLRGSRDSRFSSFRPILQVRATDQAMIKLTSRFDDAFRYAHEAHATQTRKGTGAPYVGHLMGVASIVLDDGGGEDEAIAALLHDAAEDQGGRERLDDIRTRFGDLVARIVEDCTDSFSQPKEPWLERKQAYIQHARKLSGPSLRVSAADKVHNSYAILRDLRNSGERVWARFQATPDDVLAYYESLVRAYREAGGGLLVDELDRIVRGIQREMGY